MGLKLIFSKVAEAPHRCRDSERTVREEDGLKRANAGATCCFNH